MLKGKNLAVYNIFYSPIANISRFNEGWKKPYNISQTGLPFTDAKLML